MIRVGILGAGHFGAVHARAIAATQGLRLQSVCAQNLAVAESFAARHGGTAVADWRRVVDDAAVEAVLIATPHHLHREMAAAALAAGKHVLLEKPMAPTVADCDPIIAAADASGTTLLIGHSIHFALASRIARKIIESGTIGRPRTGSAVMRKLWLEPNRRPWHLARKTGGGMLMTAGIHVLDGLLWLMDGEVSEVSARAGNVFHDQTADDCALILLRLADGRAGEVTSVGYRDGAPTYAIDVICERGTLKVDFNQGVAIGRAGEWQEVPGSWEEDWMEKAVAREWQAMREAIREGAEIPVSGRWGRHVVAAIEAALLSAHSGSCPVAVAGSGAATATAEEKSRQGLRP